MVGRHLEYSWGYHEHWGYNPETSELFITLGVSLQRWEIINEFDGAIQ